VTVSSDYAACADGPRCTVHRDGHHYATCPSGARHQALGAQIRAEQMQAALDRDLSVAPGTRTPRYQVDIDAREEQWG
jgi:hypothetical protein